MLNSVWENTCRMPQFPPLEGDAETRVLVVGGGMAGLLTAHAMTRAGIECLLIEADTVCSGVTRNTTAKITSQHGLIYGDLLRRFGAEAARLYWQVQERALEQYRLLAEKIPCDFEEKDNYVYSPDRPDRLEEELAALRQLEIPAESVRQLPLPFPAAGAVCFRRQAQFHPLKFSAGIAAGLNIREHTAAKAFAPGVVVTDRGEIRAEHIIVATHFPICNKHGSYFLKMYQDRSYVVALEHAPEMDGMYMDADPKGLSFRSCGDTLLLGGGGHRTGKKSSGWAPLEQAAKQYYPDAEIRCWWAAQDCMTLDGMAYIGQYSRKTPGFYAAAGFQKWGMTNAMAAADILCGLVQGREDPAAELFSPSRTMLRPQLLVNAAETAGHLLRPFGPRCPHLGCALQWNPREHSWDCPCHGSRFSQEGRLLDNPATGDLPRP